MRGVLSQLIAESCNNHMSLSANWQLDSQLAIKGRNQIGINVLLIPPLRINSNQLVSIS
jgi:hypothetical protein